MALSGLLAVNPMEIESGQRWVAVGAPGFWIEIITRS
jgi:hypothetical protein